MTDSAGRLPLFPLRSPLFPGGLLRLRIFERRYLDMVRDCARDGSGFGVCLLLDGDEAGGRALPAAIGTCAGIVDFYTRDDGLLGIDARGGRRFHVERGAVRDDGLILAEVRWLAVETGQPVAAEHGLLATLLQRLLEQFGELPDDAGLLDDAGWVGWRLAELLPLQPAQQQCLLQLESANERLDRLTQWLPLLSRR